MGAPLRFGPSYSEVSTRGRKFPVSNATRTWQSSLRRLEAARARADKKDASSNPADVSPVPITYPLVRVGVGNTAGPVENCGNRVARPGLVGFHHSLVCCARATSRRSGSCANGRTRMVSNGRQRSTDLTHKQDFREDHVWGAPGLRRR